MNRDFLIWEYFSSIHAAQGLPWNPVQTSFLLSVKGRKLEGRKGKEWERKAWVPEFPHLLASVPCILPNHPGEEQYCVSLISTPSILHSGQVFSILLKQTSATHTHAPPRLPHIGTLSSRIAEMMAIGGNTWNVPLLHPGAHLQRYSSCHSMKANPAPVLRCQNQR